MKGWIRNFVFLFVVVQVTGLEAGGLVRAAVKELMSVMDEVRDESMDEDKKSCPQVKVGIFGGKRNTVDWRCNVQSWQECASFCHSNDKCYAWTYYTPTHTTWPTYASCCYLKSSNFENFRTPGDELISGTRSCYPEPNAWDTLSVTFTKFNKLPMSLQNATKEGWSLIADNCWDSKGQPFLGQRYMLNGDRATILIFDINGRVAGLQMAYKTSTHTVGKYSGAYQVVEEKEGMFYYLTAYFTDPKIICDSELARGRSMVGDKLIFLAGKDKYMEAPLRVRGTAGTKWVPGRCFPQMGTHYWYDVSQDMECADHFPFFLLYNPNSQLVAWGFAIMGMTKSPRLEHLTGPMMKLVFQEKTLPKCIMEAKARTSQHVFFIEVGPSTNTCATSASKSG